MQKAFSAMSDTELNETIAREWNSWPNGIYSNMDAALRELQNRPHPARDCGGGQDANRRN